MSAQIAPYLAAQQIAETTDAAETEHALKTLWLATSFTTADNGKRFEALHRRRNLRRLGVSFCYCNWPSETTFGELPFVRQQFVLASSGSSKIGRKETVVDRSQTCIIPADASAGFLCGAEYQQLGFRIPAEALETSLTSLLGALPRGQLRFSQAPLKGANFERLRRFALTFADEVGDPQMPAVLLDELEDTFLAYFLTFNDHSHRERLLEPPTTAAPRHIAMVEEYIAANWDRPFTVEDIARVTGISARSIYATFSRYRGYGPKTFQRQVRLNKARDLLRQGRHDVATISRLCGFASAGRFARYYRAAFGELPSETRR
jgi:AraC-like DNA-binding protein